MTSRQSRPQLLSGNSFLMQISAHVPWSFRGTWAVVFERHGAKACNHVYCQTPFFLINGAFEALEFLACVK